MSLRTIRNGMEVIIASDTSGETTYVFNSTGTLTSDANPVTDNEIQFDLGAGEATDILRVLNVNTTTNLSQDAVTLTFGTAGTLALPVGTTATVATDQLTLMNAAINFTTSIPVSYTHLRAHETLRYLVCRLLLEKKK